jgi:uncharacterized protein (DUF1800 family)
MVAAQQQFAEKLVFFWHGHWATSVQKVDSAHLMLRQQDTFRSLGHGDFALLVKAMLRDPALIIWLDGQKNTKRAPNENLARELMELFTLGVGGGYTEKDVKEGARALTGWALDRATGEARFDPARFDNGSKTILGQTGDFSADGFADVLMAQTSSPRFLASRLWFRFAQSGPIPDDATQRLVSAYGGGRDVTGLARAMFQDPAFAATSGQLVKQPVEWLIGALRQLGVRPQALTDQEKRSVQGGLVALDQVVFRPPSVGGWPAGSAWLTTFALQTKLRLAEGLGGQGTRGRGRQAERRTRCGPGRRPGPAARRRLVERAHSQGAGHGEGSPQNARPRAGQPRVHGPMRRLEWTLSPGGNS